MKKRFVIFLIILIVSSVPLFASKGFNKEVIASVKAISNSEEKTIFSTIDGKSTEDKIQLSIIKDSKGNIKVVSEYFKLGKMPFKSYFYFKIKEKDIVLNDKNEYIANNIEGAYKVLSVKKPAMITGSFNQDHGTIILTSKRKNKTLTIEMKY